MVYEECENDYEEDEVMREIHKIREQIYEETKDLSREEYAEYSKRRSREIEESWLKEGYKWVPCEDHPGCTRLVRLEDLE